MNSKGGLEIKFWYHPLTVIAQGMKMDGVCKGVSTGRKAVLR